jgi:hypothetical protein
MSHVLYVTYYRCTGIQLALAIVVSRRLQVYIRTRSIRVRILVDNVASLARCHVLARAHNRRRRTACSWQLPILRLYIIANVALDIDVTQSISHVHNVNCHFFV